MARTQLCTQLRLPPIVRLLVAGVAVALALLVPGAVGRTASARTEGLDRPRAVAPAEPGAGASAETAAGRAVRLLEEWQQARSRAYSSADVAALRRLYLPGSRAGRRDLAVLRAWAARGLALELVTRTSRLSVEVARPGLVVLRQRARVVGVARLDGEERVLPAARQAWRRVTLRRLDGRWVLSAAERVPGGSPREPP